MTRAATLLLFASAALAAPAYRGPPQGYLKGTKVRIYRGKP